jgi:hypothetical protein
VLITSDKTKSGLLICPVKENFEMCFQHTRTCPSCKHQSVTNENDLILSLQATDRHVIKSWFKKKKKIDLYNFIQLLRKLLKSLIEIVTNQAIFFACTNCRDHNDFD